MNHHGATQAPPLISSPFGAGCSSRPRGTTAPGTSPRKTIRPRWDLASPAARARGDLGNRRLNARWVKYIDRKKKATVANTAIARELAGWCWSLALLEQ